MDGGKLLHRSQFNHNTLFNQQIDSQPSTPKASPIGYCRWLGNCRSRIGSRSGYEIRFHSHFYVFKPLASRSLVIVRIPEQPDVRDIEVRG